MMNNVECTPESKSLLLLGLGGLSFVGCGRGDGVSDKDALAEKNILATIQELCN